MSGSRRLAAIVAGTGVLAFVASAGAAGPPAALAQALKRTSAARSEHVSFSERVSFGSQSSTVRLSGVEKARQKDGSFALTISPAQPGLGAANEIVRGSKVYIHYAILDALHAKNPGVKHWIVLDTKSSLGVDPSGLASLGGEELQELKNVKVVGGGSDDGVEVTRYTGTLDLRKAAQSPVMRQLLAHLPSGAAAAFGGAARVGFSAGRDGFVHRTSMAIALKLQGKAVRIAIDAALTDFDHASAPIVAPAAADVMTLAQFQKLAGGAPSAADTALIRKIVLEPSQVGAGYTLSQIPGGQVVQGEVTLDFCGFSYPSESLRSGRLQVLYTAKNSAYSASNEVVTYQPGGSQQALSEVTKASTGCPNGAVKNLPSGVSRLVRHTQLLSDPQLLPGAVVILETDTATVKGKHLTEAFLDVYQVRGKVLSAVYGRASSVAVVEARTLHAAELSAANLRRYVAASSVLVA